jgi:hypothetical protein
VTNALLKRNSIHFKKRFLPPLTRKVSTNT